VLVVSEDGPNEFLTFVMDAQDIYVPPHHQPINPEDEDDGELSPPSWFLERKAIPYQKYKCPS